MFSIFMIFSVVCLWQLVKQRSQENQGFEAMSSQLCIRYLQDSTSIYHLMSQMSDTVRDHDMRTRLWIQLRQPDVVARHATCLRATLLPVIS